MLQQAFAHLDTWAEKALRDLAHADLSLRLSAASGHSSTLGIIRLQLAESSEGLGAKDVVWSVVNGFEDSNIRTRLRHALLQLGVTPLVEALARELDSTRKQLLECGRERRDECFEDRGRRPSFEMLEEQLSPPPLKPKPGRDVFYKENFPQRDGKDDCED